MSDNVYSKPEAFGLKRVAEIDLTSGYNFDKYLLWVHDDGSFWFGHDSGCSCPEPFENFTSLDRLTRVFNAVEVSQHLAVSRPHRSPVSHAQAVHFINMGIAKGLI